MTQQNPSRIVVGFTGHRRLENPRLVAGVLSQVMDELQVAHDQVSALSSAASGADTLFLEEIARRGLPYSLLLPFSKERFRHDFSAEDWGRVAEHFPNASDVEVIGDCDSDDEAYLECGLRTVDRCDLLIAVWNGEPAAGKGGTGDVVAHARSIGKPVIWIHSTTGERRAERLKTR